MRRLEIIFAAGLLWSASLWAQAGNTQDQPAPPAQPVPALAGLDTSVDANDVRMVTPPPVSGQTYPTTLTSEQRSNYLRGGVSFTGAYSDNAVGVNVNGHPVSDESYSIAPTLALDTTTSRTHFLATYAPGYTFYQHTNSRNEADQNASIEFQYRLSPHVTFSALDGFQKSSNVFNQPNFGLGGGVSGGAQGGNDSIVAPIADRLSNSGNVGLTYQYALNSMVGASGTFTNLHYPNPDQVPGLGDSSSQGGLAFYSLRVAKAHYIGATYEYQRLVAYPTAGQTETQTHAVFFFYTFYPTAKVSVSLFGGPQHSDTVQPALSGSSPSLETRSWTPAAGASLGWQGLRTSMALSYNHVITGGGGLGGAVQFDAANASLRQQLTKRTAISVNGGYAQNNMLGMALLGQTNGHSLSGTLAVQQQFGPHVNVQAGYTRLHQSYSQVAVLAATPDTNREFVSISYEFSHALGR